MVKAADRSMTIGEIMLIEKRGGRSGRYSRTQSKAGRGRHRDTEARRKA
jgi:hypothetical protein